MENCVVVWPRMKSWNDAMCNVPKRFFCHLQKLPFFNMRGQPYTQFKSHCS